MYYMSPEDNHGNFWFNAAEVRQNKQMNYVVKPMLDRAVTATTSNYDTNRVKQMIAIEVPRQIASQTGDRQSNYHASKATFISEDKIDELDSAHPKSMTNMRIKSKKGAKFRNYRNSIGQNSFSNTKIKQQISYKSQSKALIKQPNSSTFLTSERIGRSNRNKKLRFVSIQSQFNGMPRKTSLTQHMKNFPLNYRHKRNTSCI